MDIAAIGLGQAGGNIAAEFHRRGYPALALNTALTDLSALEPGGLVPTLPSESRLYIGLDGYDGAGADPEYGQQCIRAHADAIKEHVRRLGAPADAVIICAGLGGGTGSALGTLVDVLEEEDLPLVGLMTLPSEAESGLSKVNAVRTIHEVVDAALLGWIFVDNGRLSATNPEVSIADYYAHINRLLIDPLDAFNRLNDRDHVRPLRTFDGEDFRKLLLAGGILNYATAEIDALTVDAVVGTVRDCIEAGDVMPGGFDMAAVTYLGFVLEAPASALGATSVATFEQFHEALKDQTGGAAIYHGTYRTDEASPITLRVLAVTQALPQRVRQLLEDAKREGQVIGTKIREELPALELGEVQGLDLFRTHARPTERPRRPRAAGRPAPSPAPDKPSEVGRQRTVRLPELELPDIQPRRPARGKNASEGRQEDGVATPFDLQSPAQAPEPVTAEEEPMATAHTFELEVGDDEPDPSVEVTLAAENDFQRPKGEPGESLGAPVPEDDAWRPAPPVRRVMASPSVQSIPETKELPLRARRPARRRPGRSARPSEPATIGDAGPAGVTNPAFDEGHDLSLDLEDSATALGSFEQSLGRPPPADPDADTGDLPSPAIYQRLVGEYQRSTDSETRTALQRRLEHDSISENSVVRYYAVEAMSKLGRSIFGNALLAATEDEDEAVRNLAVQALKG